jgi:hypothetical protein
MPNLVDTPKKDIVSKIKGLLDSLMNRSVSVSDFYNQIASKLWNDDEETGSWSWLVDLYFDESMSLFAIVAREGKLYKTPISFNGKDVSLGEYTEVQMEFEPVSQSVRISRQKDNSVRVFLTAATSVLNRNGAIDSRDLFDNMIKRAVDTGKYPFATYCHLGEEFKMGVYDFIARDGNVLLASFKMDDNEVSRAMISAYEKTPDYWGSSISFYPLEEKYLLVEQSVRVPVYVDGEFYEISILPESIACSFFTSLVTAKEERSMDERIREALRTLAGDDEELLKDFESRVDGINRTISDKGLITRTSETETPEVTPSETPVVPEVPATSAPTQEIFVDDTVISRISIALLQNPLFGKFMQDINNSVEQAKTGVASAASALTEAKSSYDDLVKRIGKLEGTEEVKRKTWTDDLPRNQSLVVSFRPRASEVSSDGVVEKKAPLSDTANETLSRIIK